MAHLRLKYIGDDRQGRPAYKVDGGSTIYVDVYMARRQGAKPMICDTDRKSGEPDCPFVGSYTLEGAPWQTEPVGRTQTWEEIQRGY